MDIGTLTIEDMLYWEDKWGNTVPPELFKIGKDFDEQFKKLIKKIHPDINSHPQAAKAMAIVNVWKDKLEKGETIKDDVGTITYSSMWINTPHDLYSASGWQSLKLLRDEASKHFQKYYIPQNQCVGTEIQYSIEGFHIVPLRAVIEKYGGKVPHEHVNWIVNRLLEFSAWLELEGFVHAGLNPESIFILPEQHGIVIPTFYHMQKAGQKLRSISGRYANFYPTNLLLPTDKKIATNAIDIEIVMRLALYMLGNAGGLASSLRKTHNEKMLDFYTRQHTNAANTFLDHKELVSKEFEKKFHILEI